MAKAKKRASKKRPTAKRIPRRRIEIDPSVFKSRMAHSAVGEKKNYNFQPGVTEYEIWPFSTIEWVPDESKYRARAIVKHKTSNNVVVFNSWHQDYADAERPIELLSASLAGTVTRRIYNIFAETIEIHTSDMGGGSMTTVTEVLALIWSMQETT